MNVTNPNISSSDDFGDRGGKTTSRLWMFALIAGILAALISWGAGEAAQGQFPATLNQVPLELQTQATLVAAKQAVTTSTMIKKGAVAYGLLGGLLGLFLGLAGGLARRSKEDAIKAGVVGLALGAALGAGLSYVLVPTYFRMFAQLAVDQQGNDMKPSLMVHAGIWAAVGLAGGIALGLGEGGRNRILQAAIGGILGALLATVIYEVVGVTLLSAEAKSGQPIASQLTPRLMAHMLVGVFVALGAVFGSRHLHFKRPTVAASA